jgi:hemerythrin
MSNIRKIPISTGVYWVEVRHADVRILCGCPEDAVKHLLRTGLIVPMEVEGVACESGPNAILLSDLAIQNARSAAARVPVLQMPTTRADVQHPRNTGLRRMPARPGRCADTYIFRGNYGLASREELMQAGLNATGAR